MHLTTDACFNVCWREQEGQTEGWIALGDRTKMARCTFCAKNYPEERMRSNLHSVHPTEVLQYQKMTQNCILYFPSGHQVLYCPNCKWWINNGIMGIMSCKFKWRVSFDWLPAASLLTQSVTTSWPPHTCHINVTSLSPLGCHKQSSDCDWMTQGLISQLEGLLSPSDFLIWRWNISIISERAV